MRPPYSRPLDTPPDSVQEPRPMTVAELDRLLRQVVETATASAWVQGEISGLKVATSGHTYFCLKDEREEAVIDAVAYREAATRARRMLFDGARVLVRGKATVWAPRGRLQLVVDTVRPAGRGALLEALEKLKQKLLAEGLFAPERKKPVPNNARVIGVVTSASGAVIHDIIKVAFRRGSARILLSPTLVQGEEAPEAIVAALDKLEKVAGLDVIIVGRGGGSFDDLMAFNDERVVRRVAACRVPTVSAVGHEVDVTLTDLAADARAATPSQAAEMVVADRAAQKQSLAHLSMRLQRSINSLLLEDRATLSELVQRMGDPRLYLAEQQQRLDDLRARLEAYGKASLVKRRTLLDRMHRRLVARHPRAVLAQTRGRLGALELRLKGAMQNRLTQKKTLLLDRTGRLHALSPLAVLSRGYAIATDESGRALRDASTVQIGQRVAIRLRHGRLITQVANREALTAPSGCTETDD